MILTRTLLCSLLLLAFMVLFKTASGLTKLGFASLLSCVSFISISLLFPFEFPFTNTIPLAGVYPHVINHLNSPLLFLGAKEITVLESLAIVVLFVAFVRLLLFLANYMKCSRYVSSLATSFTPPWKNPKEHKHAVRCVTDPNATNAYAIGFFHHTIVMPDIALTDHEKDLIMEHEMAHIISKDIWFKLVIEILSIMYWWNPFTILLKKQMIAALEMRADAYVTKPLSDSEKIEYMECLLKVAKQNAAKCTVPALTLVSHSGESLIKRFQLITSSKKNQRAAVAVILLTALLVVMSTAFVFEPYAIKEEDQANTFAILPNSSYLIRLPSGGFELYMNDEAVARFQNIPDSLTHLCIYNSLEEVRK